MLIVKGNFGYKKDKQEQFAAIEVAEIVNRGDTDVLTNEEIVIYGYLLSSYYDAVEKRVIFRDSMRVLAGLVNIDRGVVTAAMKSLVAKGMLEKLDGGYVDNKPKKKGYIPVPKSFLLTTRITTAQKAFLLRLAALKKAGIIHETKVSNRTVASQLDISRDKVDYALAQLTATEPVWLTIEDSVVTIDYYALEQLAYAEFVTFYEDAKRQEMRLPTRLQLEFKLNTKSTRPASPAKTRLINRLEGLRQFGQSDEIELMRAAKYIKQSRLQNAEKIISAEELKLKN